MSPRKLKPECTFRPLYEAVVELLLQEGLKRKDLGFCQKRPDHPDTCPCPGLLKNLLLLYNHLPSEQSSDVLEFLSYAFDESYIFHDNFHPRYLAKNSFHCPELGITMYQPCGVTSCSFHAAQRPWSGNCILLYLVKQSDENQDKKRTALSYNELTILLDTPTSDLRKALNNALRKLRQSVLKNHIEQENKTDRQYRLLSSSVCPVCEKSIFDDGVIKRGVAYCSEICCAFKPPIILRVEQDFGLPIQHILQFCVDNFSSFNLMCDSVGLSKDVFRYYCDVYNIEVS